MGKIMQVAPAAPGTDDMGSPILASDTSPEALLLQVRLWRNMSPLEKAQATAQVSRAVRQLALAGIRLRHPDATPRELGLRLAVLTLGRDLAGKAYPEVALLEDPAE